MPIRAGFFLRRAAALALLVLALDELVKSWARARLAPCISQPSACDRLEMVGPLWLVRTANAGSAYGFVQGWWGWIALALLGLLLIPLYARLLGPTSRVAVLAVGLQVGGALGNLFDRLVLGGASDILYLGAGPTWNLADVAIAIGTVLATYALARRRLATSVTGAAPAVPSR
jgi:signal peptidase II